MSKRNVVIRACLAVSLALALVTPAPASGPSGGSGVPFPNNRVCKGGPNNGGDCMADVDCPNSKCVLDWMTGKGTTMNGTITAFFDDEVRDFFGSVDTNNQAIVIMLEVKAGGEKHMLSEVYQKHTDPTLEPQVLGWGGTPFYEDDWAGVDCEDFLYAQPDAKMKAELLVLAGLPQTKIPVVSAAKKKTQKWDRSNDHFGTTLRCKLKFRFLNEP